MSKWPVYGFHKVPHLNDGALHAENASETWEFTNEFFTRDSPDLLTIVRKKNEAEKARSAKRQGTPESKTKPGTSYPAIEGSSSTATSVDMAVIYEEIRNIKRLQSSVIGELQRLKTDNEALWTEAAEARARYDQQQTTIKKMLKFLSRVFRPSKSGTGSLPSRSRNLLTGPPAFEEVTDDPVDTFLTPEAQETGAHELSELFRGNPSWWHSLVKSGLFNIPTSSNTQYTDSDIAAYEPRPVEMNQRRNSLAAMEQAVSETDQSIGRIADVFGIDDWNLNNISTLNPQGLSLDPDILTNNEDINAQPEYRFEDFIRNILPYITNSRYGG
jgi:hypothetical protein